MGLWSHLPAQVSETDIKLVFLTGLLLFTCIEICGENKIQSNKNDSILQVKNENERKKKVIVDISRSEAVKRSADDGDRPGRW